MRARSSSFHIMPRRTSCASVPLSLRVVCRYFQQGLAAMSAALGDISGRTIAFPYQIGCGLAGSDIATYIFSPGSCPVIAFANHLKSHIMLLHLSHSGSWPVYRKMLADFAQDVRSRGGRVIVVRLPVS